LWKIQIDRLEEISPEVVEVLLEYGDVTPPKLLKTLPLRLAVDYKTKLLPDSTLLAHAPNRMSTKKLVELWKLVIALLEASIIQISKALYGASIWFQKKDGLICIYIDYMALNKVMV
jgi:hypothetical protein